MNAVTRIILGSHTAVGLVLLGAWMTGEEWERGAFGFEVYMLSLICGALGGALGYAAGEK